MYIYVISRTIHKGLCMLQRTFAAGAPAYQEKCRCCCPRWGDATLSLVAEPHLGHRADGGRSLAEKIQRRDRRSWEGSKEVESMGSGEAHDTRKADRQTERPMALYPVGCCSIRSRRALHPGRDCRPGRWWQDLAGFAVQISRGRRSMIKWVRCYVKSSV